jgi:hypothetical protein
MQPPNAQKTDNKQGPDQEKQPKISLPKGGGAIQGIGEKFQVNPVTGTGSLSIPIAMRPGRSGFTPQLALSYDSGAGNSPFGMGWSVGIPSISRKTQKGIPRYEDEKESDIFLLSGAEDLVPVLTEQPDGSWEKEKVDDSEYTIYNGETYDVYRYRPRIEVTFAEVRRHLGVESQRQWSDLAIERSTPCLMALMSIVCLMANNLH